MSKFFATSASRHPTGSSARWQTYIAWTLQVIVTLVFLAAGAGKLSGVDRMVGLFEQIGFGQWLRYLTGTLEIGGALLILWPRTAFMGALLLACVMLGAVLTHLVLIGGSALPALTLLILTAVIAWLRRPAR